MTISIKIHKSYRIVVAICDTELIGKKFEEDIRQLELKDHFFKGQEYNYEDAVKLIHTQIVEDATFNIVGENAINASIEAGAITKDYVGKIQNVPFALKLL